MNLRIDDMIAPTGGAHQTLLTPATKEAVADTASGGVWVNRNMRQVIRTVVNRITPGTIGNSVSSEPAPYQFLIGIVTTPPTVWTQREPAGCEEATTQFPCRGQE